MEIEVGKKYLTRDGHVAEVAAYKADAMTTHQFIGWIEGGTASWDVNGSTASSMPSESDLIASAPERVTMYCNMYIGDRYGSWYAARWDGPIHANRYAVMIAEFEENKIVPETIRVEFLK